MAFDFAVGEELELVVETARAFAAAELAPQLREAERARAPGPRAASRFAETGLAVLELPEALSGAGQGALARVLVNEELGAGDPGAALALDPLGPAAGALFELGGLAALRELALPLLARPGARALVLSEGEAGLAIGADAVTGSVAWVPADRVDLLLVVGEAGAVAVREGTLRRELRGSGLRAAGASELHLSAARVAARWQEPAAAARARARARLYFASLLLGVLREAAEFSRRYAMQRVAFGRPIAHHQALAFLIADMRAAVDGARLLVHEAAWQLDAGLPAAPLAAAAFAEAIEASQLVGPSAVQILGGHGFMQDYPVEKHMREARALGLVLGGIDAAREEAGRAVCAARPFAALSAGEA